jgi:hypothetical protein
MAYMNQERKAKLAPAIKAVLKKYGIRGTISTDRHSLSVNIKAGKLDFIQNFNTTCGNDYYQVARGFIPAKDYLQINPYHYDKHFSGTAADFFRELIEAMNVGNHDNSDIMTDYFDVGWYTHVNVGRWNKPYVVEA